MKKLLLFMMTLSMISSTATLQSGVPVVPLIKIATGLVFCGVACKSAQAATDFSYKTVASNDPIVISINNSFITGIAVLPAMGAIGFLGTTTLFSSAFGAFLVKQGLRSL